jgi:hypothetical protein
LWGRQITFFKGKKKKLISCYYMTKMFFGS